MKEMLPFLGAQAPLILAHVINWLIHWFIKKSNLMFSRSLVALAVWISALHYCQVHCSKVPSVINTVVKFTADKYIAVRNTAFIYKLKAWSLLSWILQSHNSVSFNRVYAAKYTAFMNTAVIYMQLHWSPVHCMNKHCSHEHYRHLYSCLENWSLVNNV